MPNTDQIELEHERITAAIDNLRTHALERFIKNPPEGSAYMLEIFQREKAGFKMSDAWCLARERTLAARGLAQAAADIRFKDGTVAESFKTAIGDIIEATAIVRTAKRAPLFTNAARARLVKLLSIETIASYTNHFAQIAEPGVPTCETFREAFYPKIWADYQTLVAALQCLITDCRMRSELNGITGESRATWASLGILLEDAYCNEPAMNEQDAISLIDGMMKQDRADRAVILLRTMPLGKPLQPENKRKIYSDAVKKYCLRLWKTCRSNPGELSSLARVRNVDFDLQGRKVRYEDVYRVHEMDFAAHKYDIKSAEEFEHAVRAAQTQSRRENARKATICDKNPCQDGT